jgi:excisionase family DNA binding protein
VGFPIKPPKNIGLAQATSSCSLLDNIHVGKWAGLSHYTKISVSRCQYAMAALPSYHHEERQAADLLGMRPVTVRMWAATRRIGRVKLSRAVRIPESEVNRLIERNLIPALPERER